MNQRKTLEVMWLNIKVCKKRRGKRFEGKGKKISSKTNSILTTPTPASSRTSSSQHANTLATQMFDTDQTSFNFLD